MLTHVQKQDFDHYKNVLKGHYGQATYENWFQNLNLLANDGIHLVLGAPSSFSASQIDQRFGPNMKDLWQNNVGPIDRLSIKQAARQVSTPGSTPPKPSPSSNGHSTAFTATSQPPASSTRSNGSFSQRLHQKTRSLQNPARQKSSMAQMARGIQHQDINLAAPLDDRMTFDRFCAGEPNRLALAAFRNIMRDSQQRLILLYGPSGYGKTHLLNAVGHEWLATYETANVLYLTYDNLLNGYVSAVLSKSVNELRAYLNEIDILLVDDVHLLRGRKATQEELLCLIDRLVAAGKKVVVAANMSAAKLAETGLSPRLTSRLSGGLGVGLNAPDYNLRLKVLEQADNQATESGGVPLEREHLELIAKRCETSVRELEGIFSMVRLHRDAADTNIAAFDLSALKELLKDQMRHKVSEITHEDILDAVVERFGVSAAEVRSLRRQQPIARARHAFCFICRQVTEAPLKAIGASIKRDHTTVISSISRAEVLAETDAVFGERISSLLEAFET